MGDLQTKGDCGRVPNQVPADQPDGVTAPESRRVYPAFAPIYKIALP